MSRAVLLNSFSSGACDYPHLGVLSIPKGLYHSAQGCEARATLGTLVATMTNPEGVEASVSRSMAWETPKRAATPSGLRRIHFTPTQGSSLTRNPGLEAGIPLGFKRGRLARYKTEAASRDRLSQLRQAVRASGAGVPPSLCWRACRCRRTHSWNDSR